METKELIKKFWFVGVVGIILVAFIGLYAIDSVKNKPVTVQNKQVNGQYVAYSIDDTNITADELFDTLNQSNGVQVSFVAFERAVFDKAYPTTQEMKDEASLNAAGILQYYGEEYIRNILNNMGYLNGTDDLVQYYIDSTKQDMLVKDFALANAEDVIVPELGTDGRLIYHILVKINDVAEIKDEAGNTIGYEANPTEEETAKLNSILVALSENVFEQVAYEYSDDTGSANRGGYIGIVNNENAYRYDMAFAAESLSLADGEVSNPICSQFGYHIIYNAGSTNEALTNDRYFIQSIQQNYPTLIVKAIVDKADEFGFEVVDEDLKNFISLQTGGQE